MVDDRTFRGCLNDVVQAVRAALEFDSYAGLRNNLAKFVAMSTQADARAVLSKTKFNHKLIRVALEDTLVGFNVSVRRSIRRVKQDTRILESIRIAKRAAASVIRVEMRSSRSGRWKHQNYHQYDLA